MSSDQWSVADNHGRKAIAPGTLIGAYRIEAPLGEGGMGTVYRALDTKLNRPVAIKFLSDDLADAAARRRFQREAQMASSLNHPHILTVYDVGDFEGRQYIVTEFVDGGTLKDWARQEKRTWKQIVELLTGVADGLAAAHTAGILHRDIKPANILVAKNGYAKLADFGLAKLAKAPPEGDATQTLTEGQNTGPGAIVGTIAYMSPEQASGRPLDARSDISSFGVVLYELLAGRRPFSGSSELEILQTIIHGTPEPLGPDVPFVLGLIVGKALDKDPADRYQSARELVVDLRRLARQKVAEPVPPVVVAQPGRSYWILAAAVLLLGVGGVTGWLAKRPSAAEANPLVNARFTRLTDFEGVERSAAISADGRFVAFLSDRSGPFDIWVTQVGTGSAVNLTQGKTGNLDALVGALGFSGDGSQIWFHEADVTAPLRILPLMGGASRVFLASSPVKEPPYNVAWSPDGTRLVYFTADPGDPMFVTDHTGASPHQILRDNPGLHNHYPVWSRDGEWIYFVRGSVTTSQMDMWRISPNGGEPERLTQHNSQVSSPAPLDLRTVVYVARDRDGSGPCLWALDVDSKTTRRIQFRFGEVRPRCRQCRWPPRGGDRSEPHPELVYGADPESGGGRNRCLSVPGGFGESAGPALRRRNPLVLFILSRHRRWAMALRGWPDHGDLERLRRSATGSSGRFPGRTARRHHASPQWKIDAARGHRRGQRIAAARRVDRYQWRG